MLQKKKTPNEYERSIISYFKEISLTTPLDRDNEYDLWKQYKYNHNITARNKLVTSNLKFVANVARHYQGMGLSYSDLIAEGNMGLLKALDKFDGDKGNKVISYSVFWIKQAIIEALKKRNLIQGEDICHDKINTDETQEECEDDVNEYIETEDETEIYTDDSTIESILACLSDRERLIIVKYFGLDGGDEMTLEEIGKTFGLTKERVRQISERALNKMREHVLKYNL